MGHQQGAYVMKKLTYSAVPAALLLALAACGDSPAEERADVQEEANEALGDIMDEQAEALDAEADALDDAGLEAEAAAKEAEADRLEDTADGI